MDNLIDKKINQFKKRLFDASKITARKGSIEFYQKGPYPESEKVERKGIGHPDTLVDSLAMTLSREYSLYTINKFGVILNHNFDKIGLMGGRAIIEFQGGKITSPIRVLINGRASDKFGNETIPLKELLIRFTEDFFKKRFPMLEVKKDLRIIYEVSNGSSPGQVNGPNCDSIRNHWFSPRDFNDIKYLSGVVSNDTSTGFSYYPLSKTGIIVLKIENILNSRDYKKNKPWLGSDIKITASRHLDKFDITLAIPQICFHVKDVEAYLENLEVIRSDVFDIIKCSNPELHVNISINTRDNIEGKELYLTYTGSSIEMGDEGFVGRGNRVEGLIDMTKPYSMEGASGKNPVYHIGMVYSEMAKRISKKIFDKTGFGVEISLTSQSGRPILDPWDITVFYFSSNFDEKVASKIIYDELDNLPQITIDFLYNKFDLF